LSFFFLPNVNKIADLIEMPTVNKLVFFHCVYERCTAPAWKILLIKILEENVMSREIISITSDPVYTDRMLAKEFF